MGNRLNRLKKIELVNLVDLYESQLNILDLILSDMSEINLGIVHLWLNDTNREADKIYNNEIKEDNYIQLNLFGDLQ